MQSSKSARPTSASGTAANGGKIQSGHPYLIKHNHCSLCGSVLRFHHRTNFGTNRVVEKAECTECGIQTRVHEGDLH